MTTHFIGIGGIGMSALARILLQENKKVSGSDKSDSFIVKDLINKGAKITLGHQKLDFENTELVVYSTAISPNNLELLQAKEKNLKIIHRSELLEEFLRKSTPILVTGAHGKTSTSALLAWTLEFASLDPSFVIGGLLKPKLSNSYKGSGKYFVAEADESDGSFLKTKYFKAIITNYDLDHIDFWKTESRLKEAYKAFIEMSEGKKDLVLCGDDPFLKNFDGTTYGFSDQVDFQILNYAQNGLAISFDIAHQNTLYKNISFPFPGKHYALNVAAVFALCIDLGISDQTIKEALKSFPGVKRRLDCIGDELSTLVFDDYAHHPKELETLLTSLKVAYPDKRLVCVFQPHRFTRLEKYTLEFAKALTQADIPIVTDVFSAGEIPPNKNIFSNFLETVHTICHNGYYVEKTQLLEKLKHQAKLNDVIVFAGAGDISGFAKDFAENKIKEMKH